MGWFASPRQLAQFGILGMNARNVRYIARYNPRHYYPRVDDKLVTKRLAEEAGLAAPRLLGVVRYQHQVRDLPDFLDGLEEFVIKPSKGAAGKGILVITGREGDLFRKPSGALVGVQELGRHVTSVLAGLFTLGGKPDVAMVEALVHFSDTFENYTYQGVPDIRTVVFRGYPVMAMVRLSTQASDGRANLHQGAVGVGIDIASGRTLRAVLDGQPVGAHPDTKQKFDRLQIPHWRDLLVLASRSADVTGLGYLGVDVVLDAHRGPLILELNARPGLAIQMANGAGLAPRLAEVEALATPAKDPEQRVAWAMSRWTRHPAALPA